MRLSRRFLLPLPGGPDARSRNGHWGSAGSAALGRAPSLSGLSKTRSGRVVSGTGGASSMRRVRRRAYLSRAENAPEGYEEPPAMSTVPKRELSDADTAEIVNRRKEKGATKTLMTKFGIGSDRIRRIWTTYYGGSTLA